MIIKGGSRANARFYAGHLARVDTNERVHVVETRGLVADDIEGAFQEMAGLASGTRCKNSFYVVSLNPYADEHLTPEQWEQAANTLERHLGLDGQARLIVEHEKEGRTHQHIVWSRINPDSMTAISDSLTYPKHEAAAREIEQAFGLAPVESVLVKDREAERPERRPSDWESFRSQDTGIDPQKMKAEITALWQKADSGKAFAAALEDAGYILAKGDRRDFCIIDSAGDEHSLARRISGVKAAEVRARMSDIDRDALPSVAEAREAATSTSSGDAPETSAPEHHSILEGAKPLAEGVEANAAALEQATTGDTPTPSQPEEAPSKIPPDRQEAPRGTPADWIEAPKGTPPDWVEAPKGTPPDWIEAPRGTLPDGREPAPRGAGQDWQTAAIGQGSDQRAEHTAWESFAGRVRGYWQRLTQFARDQTSGAPTPPQPEAEAPDAGGEAHKSWVERVMESKAVQAARHLFSGYRHRDGVEFVEGLTETAAIVEDILAKGPRQPGAGSTPPVEATEPDASAQPAGGKAASAFDRIISADAAKPETATPEALRKTPSAFDKLVARQGAEKPDAPTSAPEPERDDLTPEH